MQQEVVNIASRVIFLGTAGSSAVVSRQVRASGGIIFQADELQFHLDPGPGSLNKAKEYGINVHHTTAILVSHNHLNHCNDLNIAIEAMTHGGIEQRGLVLASKSVVQQNPDEPSFLTSYHKKMVERIIPLEKNHKVGIDMVEVHALPAEHTDPTAIGFKFFCPKFTLSYTGDTKLHPGLLEELAGTDLLILNVPYGGNKAQGMNLDMESAIKIISHIRPKLAILTHFGLELLKSDPLAEAREVQRITGVPVVAAHDGLSIAPSGYANYSSPVKGY